MSLAIKNIFTLIFFTGFFFVDSSAQVKYVTGSSAGDNKLKAFNKKMDLLDKHLEEFEIFLRSDEVYDHKKHFHFDLSGEGAELILTHALIERDMNLPLDDIEKGKVYAKEYLFAEEKKRHEDFVSKYNSSKQNSHERAVRHKTSKEKVQQEASPDFKFEQNRTQEMFAKKATEDFSSVLYTQNIGKIIFSTDKVTKSAIDAKTNNLFNHTDIIYGRAYFKTALWNTVMYDETNDSISFMDYQSVLVYADVYVDDIKQELKLEQYSGKESEFRQALTRQIWLHPEVSDGLTEVNWIKIIAAMSTGSHKVRIDYCVFNTDDTGKSKSVFSKVIATGEFTLNKSSDILPEIGKKWSDIKAGMNNTSLENQALAIAKKNSNIDNMISEQIKILDKDWRIIKKESTGEILYRYLRVLLKTSHDDGYCYSTPMEIKQEYSGNGQYSSTVKLVSLSMPDFGYQGYLDCE